MDFKAHTRGQLEFAHNTIEQVMSDCGDLLNKKMPGSSVNSPASIYAHAVIAEDFILNGMIAGRPPIFVAGDWAGKTGVPPVQQPNMNDDWASKIQMSLPAFQEYARQVYAATDQILAEMTDAQAQEQIDTPFGNKQGRLELVSNLGVTHLWGHLGEIAAIKGAHGLKGLPF